MPHVLLFFLSCLALSALSEKYNDCIYQTGLYPIDLRVLGNSNGTAKFSNIPDKDPNRRRVYSYNGCFPFGKNEAIIMSKFFSFQSRIDSR
jgi:hypothetical protein